MERSAWLRLETAFELVLLAIGCAIAFVSWGYGFGSFERPGPGLYPFFVGLAIALLALLTLRSALRAPHRPALDPEGSRVVLSMTATFCFWIAAMPLLGYVLVTLIATFVFCKVMKLEGWRRPLAVAVGTALFIYLLFDVWLYIDLPRGLFV